MNQTMSGPTPPVTIFTIGFGQKGARQFFGILTAAGVRKVVDVRLNNVSQLAGFTKRDDLAYFLEALCGISYEHHPELAPTKEMLDDYRSGRVAWPEHERRLRVLFSQRGIETLMSPQDVHLACLLCVEPSPDQCHRRIAAEHLREHWGTVTIRHL